MKLIVGLGNPGQKYKNNRHNVGFMVVDQIVQNAKRKTQNNNLKFKIKFQIQVLELPDIILARPQTFMNRSGAAVKNWLKNRKGRILPNLYVVHDDLDIELGKFKISFGKGPKVHNGLNSIYDSLSSKDFWHVRIGIDNRMKTGFKGTGEEYVLEDFRTEEREIIEGVMGKVVKELAKILC